MLSSGAPRVVVVEDSDEDYDTILEAVQRSEIALEIRRAMSGGECLAMLRGDAKRVFQPDLVLMDLNTPGIDGREALQEIKSDPSLRSCPVVVFSTSANPKDLSFCYLSGANAYHVKPVRYPEHLQALIELFVYWFTHVTLPDPAEKAP